VPHLRHAELFKSGARYSRYTKQGAPQEGQLEIEFKPENTMLSPSGRPPAAICHRLHDLIHESHQRSPSFAVLSSSQAVITSFIHCSSHLSIFGFLFQL